MLPDPKPHCLSLHFDRTLQNFFEKGDEVEYEAISDSVQAIYNYPIERQEFYQLLNRALVKILKREVKKLEELISFHCRNIQQAEFNRIKLNKVLKECFLRVEEAASCIHDFVIEIESKNEWECHCMKEVCEQRQSCEQFVQDVFSYFARSSQSLNETLQAAAECKVVLHHLLPKEEALESKEWKLGTRPGELMLEIENSCEKVKKARKRKRNKKAREKQERPMKREEPMVESEEDQKRLCSFLQELEIDPDLRQNCIVTGQWLERVAKRAPTHIKH